MNSFINMKGCSSNDIKRNLIQWPKKRWFTSIAPEFRYVILASMKKCMHKIENMPLQTSSIFSHPWQMSQTACFSSKILCVVTDSDRKPRACQKLGVGPGVGKCPASGQRRICKCPTPGTDRVGKCPTVARGWGWAHLELTDALYWSYYPPNV